MKEVSFKERPALMDPPAFESIPQHIPQKNSHRGVLGVRWSGNRRGTDPEGSQKLLLLWAPTLRRSWWSLALAGSLPWFPRSLMRLQHPETALQNSA